MLKIESLTRRYPHVTALDGLNMEIGHGQLYGFVGPNGAGKTTLLNMLTGELPCDEGEFFVSQNMRIGYLKQRDNFSSEGTVLEEIEGIFSGLRELENEIAELSDKVAENPHDTGLINRLDELQHRFDREGGYTYKSEMIGILNSMAFDESFYNKKISSLSGGERTRLALAALLLEKPDILLLDEPTNHLDIGTLKWLEQYLEAYRGTIMIVSHDRYFLDRTVNRIFEVENHKVYSYQGKYSDYAAQKKLRRETELRAYNNQQREIARQEEMIRRMKQRGTEHLAKRAASREKRLDMLERIERPESEMGKMKINFKENFPSGGDVIMAENLEKSFGRGTEHRELFHGVNLDIKRGERICILGTNGVGKTTLLRVLLGELTPDAGYLKIGHNVAFGYYDQGQLLLSDANTVLEELKESYRLYTDTEMRSILGRFLFRGEEVFLPVGSLSGGEKARLSLLKLMLSGANTLILDEPTNHLDIESKEVFEEALMEFPGTVIVVSHDRYFLQRIPTRILELTQDGVIEYLGRYDYYLEKKSQGISAKKYFSKVQEKPAGDAAQQRRLKKEREAEERRRARLSEKLETEISELEDKISELEHNLCKPENMSDYELLARLGAEREETEKRLAEAYDEWAKVQEA